MVFLKLNANIESFCMRLKSLAKKLILLGLTKEAEGIIRLSSKEVFAHISGPSGSGKTTLMEEIGSLYPDVVEKDLDEFDEEATEEMGLDKNWKQTSWSEDTQREHYAIKQSLLDNFIEQNSSSKILLVGLHTEGDDSLSFNARHKIILDTSPSESIKRRIKRDKESGGWNFWDDKDSLTSEIEESKRVVSYLKSEGYTSMSPEEILSLF
jgi:uridine kinase